MDKETLLRLLASTLDANVNVRRESEQKLRVYEEAPGFTGYLLELITDPGVSLGVQVLAAIFFKNRVTNFWVVPELKAQTARYVPDGEKPAIKGALVETLSKTYLNSQLRLQLAAAMHNILSVDKWDELMDLVPRLVGDTGNVDHVTTGLICLYEYTKNYRFAETERGSSAARNVVLDDVAERMFPALENLAHRLLSDDSATADELLYLVMKIFKFCTFAALPTYLQRQETLGAWCNIHLMLINKPLPLAMMQEDEDVRLATHRAKAVKWCFGNLLRMFTRHGGGVSTKDKESPFAKMFVGSFVPEILGAYWSIIEKWLMKQTWLSEGALYHLIAFLEQTIESPTFPLLEDKLEAVVKHVLLPTLNATQTTIELYEDDPEEYVRRFFDFTRDTANADTASINFIYRLALTKFASSGPLLLGICTEIFQKRAADKGDVGVACQTEGALRILATISHKLNKRASPVRGQVDQLLQTVVLPELSPEIIERNPWLTARACDTIAVFCHSFTDQNILQQIFHGVVSCFQRQDQFPIQLTAIDALRSLVDEELVASQIAEQAPQLMGTLLDMLKQFESDILTTVMDVFVERFAANLEPYANELSARLVEQFNKLAQDLLNDEHSGSYNTDKEYQAAGILNTITSLVISMSASSLVSSSLELVLKDMIKSVLDNSMSQFLTEVCEMMESIISATEQMSPTMWELYDVCIGCFDTYADDFFDIFQPYLMSVVQKGFAPSSNSIEQARVQALFKVCFQMLTGDNVEPVFASLAFELLESSILSLDKNFVPFMPQFLLEILNIFSTLEAQDAFDGFMLHYLSVIKIFFACLHVDPAVALQFMNEKQFTAGFFRLWIKYSADFQSVYGCKLQIFAALGIVVDAPLESLPSEDLVGESVSLLISNLDMLPHAIKARKEILERENGNKSRDFAGTEEDNSSEFDYYEDFEADEAELEAMKITPIDDLNAYKIFATKAHHLQQTDNARYLATFGSLDDQQKEIAQRVSRVYELMSS